ncbi:MAG: family 16 glycoside hydrolase, partial [Pirellulaceae bacterium]
QQPLANYHFDHPGASAVYSSAHDLIRFASLHLKKPLADQKSPLSDEWIDEMQRPTVITKPGVGYGVGWRITESEYGFRTVTHTGGMPGVRTRLTLVPSEGIAVAALTNSRSSLPHRVVEQTLATLLPKYAQQRRRASYQRTTPAPPFPWKPPLEWVGYWTGAVETYTGQQAVKLWVQADGDVHVQLNQQLKHLLNQVRLENGFLTGIFPGNLNTPDVNRRPHQLALRIRLRDKQLNGSLTALSLQRGPQNPAPDLPQRSGYALSHWVNLSRKSTLAAPRSLFDGKQLGQWEIIKKNDFEKHGTVTVKNGIIALPAGQPATGIRWKGTFPRNHYEVSLQARRTKGSDFFCGLTFPFNESYLSLIIGGWGGGVTGLSNIDNMAAVENETTGYLDVKDNRWYQVRLRVTPERIRAWIDQEEILDLVTKDHKFSIWWEQEPVRPFGIASWYTAAELRQIRIIPAP